MACKQDAFAKAVLSAAKSADTKALSDALGKIVKARRRERTAKPVYAPVPIQGKAQAVRRRSARRVGAYKSYTPTTKPDYSRPGTFRHYMIATIRAHTDTWSANSAHAACEEPKYAKNRLDFNWAADNGYIEWK